MIKKQKIVKPGQNQHERKYKKYKNKVVKNTDITKCNDTVVTSDKDRKYRKYKNIYQ